MLPVSVNFLVSLDVLNFDRAEPTSVTNSTSRQYPDRPLLGVSTFIADHGNILLVKRANSPPVWSFPGGLVEIGETLHEAAIREVREETGIEVKIGRLATVLDIIQPDEVGRIKRHYALAVYVAVRCGGKLCAGDDAEFAEWVSIDQFSERELTPGTNELAIKLYGEVIGR
jgi:8-oxo-dGTP diphosphatase